MHLNLGSWKVHNNKLLIDCKARGLVGSASVLDFLSLMANKIATVTLMHGCGGLKQAFSYEWKFLLQ